MTVHIPRKLFTVTEYARMRETGILSEDDRVELLDGEIRIMSPIGPLHAAIVKRFNKLLSALVGTDAIVGVQDPIQLNAYGEPQPDITVLQPRPDFYAQSHPVVDDIFFVIEVSDTTLDYDRDEKLPKYAQANITEAWIVDVSAQTIEQYTQPRGEKYLLKQIFEPSDSITSHSFPKIRLKLNDIFAVSGR